MKKVLASFVVAVMFVIAVLFVALEREATSQDVVDPRRELKLPPRMKVMQKKMMRKHMDTLSEITKALAEGRLKVAARIARERLGWSPTEEKRCRRVSNITGEPDFLTLGMAVHRNAERLADAAEAGKRTEALKALADLINSCNACHKRFKH